MKFLSKANTLASIENYIQTATILPQYIFTVEQWQSSATEIIDVFFQNNQWAKSPLVVRSSGIAEDTANESLAGHFQSILSVEGSIALNQAIADVITSFGEYNSANQIFIQPMLNDVVRSGVVFTKEPSTNSPYYVINYSESGDTDAVTSGALNEALIYVAKCGCKYAQPDWVNQLIQLCKELEIGFHQDSLDIEFAFSGQGELFLFQVRPLILNSTSGISLAEQQKLLQSVHNTIERLSKPHPYLNGTKSVLGVMPDWNPAEIIGIRPNPLALSLYKELVTDSTWAYQRNNYGYKQLRSFPLLINLAGLPYIDVRVSFNSFIPADIPDELAEKLVNHYLFQLENSPEKHDKIEFDIIFSCFTLDVETRLLTLNNAGFSQQEIDVFLLSLKKLTNNIINPNGLWMKDIAKIESLPKRRETIINSELTKIEKIYWLLEDCKRYGTLPFAGLARAGFIAVQLLKSIIVEGLLTQVDYDKFMRSLETISSNMAKDRAELSFNTFLAKYGHLRPGTYDILSPRYDQAPEKYFDDKEQEYQLDVCEDFVLSLKQLEKLQSSLESHGIEHDVISLFRFIKGAIEGREYAKFIFSQSLSDAILLMEELGEEMGIIKNDMAFCDISTVYKMYSSSEDILTVINRSIGEGKAVYKNAQALILPPLLINAEDVYCFKMPENEPNFITMKHTVSLITNDLENIKTLSNKIVFIPSADPGFDWLFSHGIAGLITKYGGANSHMAIRAGELGIPSVIGAGEVLYEKWKQANLLELDAANRKVVILK
ncbi:MAG: phosphohistidine swiveling domain-containing protein [Colwellia sp.]|jgi:phosphohistidine swiveling domain-containing protein